MKARARQLFRLYWGVVAVYSIFAVFVAILIRNSVRYSNVENWPYVLADEVNAYGSDKSTPSVGMDGMPTQIPVSRQRVQYRYHVDGVEYYSLLVTPNGGNLSEAERPVSGKYRVFYKPDSPSIAVLNRREYDGTLWIIGIGFAGVIVFMHIVTKFV